MLLNYNSVALNIRIHNYFLASFLRFFNVAYNNLSLSQAGM